MNAVRAVDIQVIGEELAIKWDDGTESFIRLETLRRACPCAACQGGRELPEHSRAEPPPAFQLERVAPVGAYGVQPVWADGHNTGLFTYDYLWELTHADPRAPAAGAPAAGH